LSRMVLGMEANVMSIVYGPAKQATWQTLQTSSIGQLASENGLWQAIYYLSDYVLIDSPTLSTPYFFNHEAQLIRDVKEISFAKASYPSNFSEDDTDCAIHQIFAHKQHLNIYEGLCNPPGGDWSGISCFTSSGEYRWTSLPRVSHIGGKRPDHVIQIRDNTRNIFLSIESKGEGKKLEPMIGKHLSDYLKDLFQSTPNAYRIQGGEWISTQDLEIEQANPHISPYSIFSIGAFLYNEKDSMLDVINSGSLDAVMAFELGKESTIHICDITEGGQIIQILNKATRTLDGIKIQVH